MNSGGRGPLHDAWQYESFERLLMLLADLDVKSAHNIWWAREMKLYGIYVGSKAV